MEPSLLLWAGALAWRFIERGHHRYGSEVYIKIRKQLVKAEVVQLPFVTAKTVKSLSMDEV